VDHTLSRKAVDWNGNCSPPAHYNQIP
jgi:hypothetical protein